MLGWHAPALRRAVLALSLGLVVALTLMAFTAWELALVGGWDATAFTFLTTVWPIIIRADGAHAAALSAREDETRGSATFLLIGASLASLLGVGFALGLAGRESGSAQIFLITVAVLTVMLSWVVVNTVYTLHYAHLQFQSTAAGLAFDDSADRMLTYRDFAYVAFTIGMTYQVSDTTVRDPKTRRTVLSHALVSYLFGVVIVAGSVNLIAGLFH
jgi:uncharacterized membrane protein